MSRKIVIIADPGIDTAFAITLALRDPNLEVVGLIGSAGNVTADRATQNLHILVNEIDAQRWPRIGSALAVEYDRDGTQLHGPSGLGGAVFPPITLHQPTPGDKLLVELVRAHPQELTIVVLGPATMLARTMDRDPDLLRLIDGIVMVGGARHEPGNVSAVSEFHFFLDPTAARRVLHSGASVTLIPLDVTRKLIFSPSDLLELPSPESPASRFLRQIVPYGIRASSNFYGIEGFHLKDVLGVAALALPGAIKTQLLHVDVEPRGELTRGMTIVDTRPNAPPANVQFAVSADTATIRSYIRQTLSE